MIKQYFSNATDVTLFIVMTPDSQKTLLKRAVKVR